jgi:hypothetical protein
MATTVVLTDLSRPQILDPQGVPQDVNDRVARLIAWLLTHQALFATEPFTLEVNVKGKAMSISCPTVYLMPET